MRFNFGCNLQPVLGFIKYYVYKQWKRLVAWSAVTDLLILIAT